MLMTCYWSHVKNTRPENLDCDAKNKVWKYIPWDLKTLSSGIHPVLDATGLPWPVCSAESKVQGQPLAGGYFLYLGLSKETWSIMPMCWVWNTGKELCIPACFAKLTGPTGLGLTTNSWAIPSCSGPASHPNVHRLFSILAVGLWSCQLDIMHTVSLGVAQHIAGSILYQIIYAVLASRGTVKNRV